MACSNSWRGVGVNTVMSPKRSFFSSSIACSAESISWNAPSTPCIRCLPFSSGGAVFTRLRRVRIADVELVFELWIGVLHARRYDLLDLRHRHRRQLLDEEQEPHEEPAEAAEQNPVVHPCRLVRAPLPRLELVRQRRDDDDEPLEPHAEVDEQRQDEQPSRIAAELLTEERQRQDHVADEHDPRSPRPLAEHAVPEVVLLEPVAAHPRDLELGEIRESDDHRREEAELRRGVEIVERDVVFELECLPQRNGDGEHHPDTGEDRAGDEVRREDRRVPTRREPVSYTHLTLPT